MNICPDCGSEKIIKYGKIHNGKHRFNCKDCGRQFVQNPENKIIPEYLKDIIDKLLLEKIPLAGIARAVIALAKSLNLNIIAEGVETKEQRDFIVENGCENIQGYYYSKPIPADEFEIILTKMGGGFFQKTLQVESD